MANPAPQVPSLLVPIKLDAFILTETVVNAKVDEAKIAPITQPNYTFLRVKDYMVENDILPHVNLHNSTPANKNSRVTDLGNGATRENRIGIYLHWILPRFYRGGEASTKSVKDPNEHRIRKGLHAVDIADPAVDTTAPHFRRAPNRWLVIRKLAKESILPAGADIDLVKTWVVESDRMRGIDDLDVKVDLQVDVSPFITSGVDPDKSQDVANIDIDQQAEVFIGYRADAKTWSETKEKPVDRVELSVASSSNQLFPDFQHHCSNVFSMVDTLEGRDGVHVESAKASYYVIGWHDDPKHDPMYMKDEDTKRRVRLQSLNLSTIRDEDVVDEIKTWLESTDSTRTLCHGSMYEIKWLRHGQPTHVPANKCSELLSHKMQVSVGTTPIDSLLSYVKAHHNSKVQDLEDDIFQLQKLLRAQDDSVDGLAAAEDELQSHNFAKFGGGSSYKFPDDKDAKIGEAPNESQAKKLRELNAIQRYMDALGRRKELLQWQLFSEWWKYISDFDNRKGMYNDSYRKNVEDLEKLYGSLITMEKKTLTAKEEALADLGGLKLKEAVLQDFHQQNDPTMMIAGVSAGWPRDFLESLDVRLDSQVITLPAVIPDRDLIFSLHCPPQECLRSCQGLIEEFVALLDESTKPEALQYAPQFHDRLLKNPKKDEKNPWRDRFDDTQTWFPLFVEWEAEYSHIPFENWDLLVDEEKRVRFGLSRDVTKLRNTRPDYRVLSGRSLILPQPVFSLGVSIDRLFNTVSPDELNAALPEAERKELRNNLDRLAFLSFPLEGLTNHLLTLTSGNHIKPTVRATTKEIQALKQAELPDIGFFSDQISHIGTQSDLVPYSVMVSLLKKQYSAFKPVTHGQLRFTKLNVIDKFGQVAHALDPDPRINHGPEKLYPCIGDYYAPQKLANGSPNVVAPDPTEGYNEFIQLPPTINQPCRLNSSFVVQNKDNPDLSAWRPSSDWESPVWGWIVVNYVDHGLQVFLPDGSFYREIRLAAPGNEFKDGEEVKWLPFEAPEKSSATGQLDKLLHMLATERQYLVEFLSMIQAASEKLAPAPNAYGQFVNSLVGRPLALVHTGWSLELSHNPRQNQSTIRNPETPIINEPALLGKTYSFKVKFGDKDRSFDGMVAYFNAKKPESPQSGDELDLSAIFTYFVKDEGKDQTYLRYIRSENYPKLVPTYNDPVNYFSVEGSPGVQYEARSYSNFQHFGAIIDPFVAMHAYTSILPNQPLKLPPWTWESAFKKMRTFFHWGPMLLTKNVPDFDPGFALRKQEQYDISDPAQVFNKAEVAMPSLSVADWAWLQPYENGKAMAINIGEEEQQSLFPEGSYTAVEGYMQMKAPITKEKAPAAQKK